MLSILAFSLLIIPIEAFATAGYVDNPTPYISSISPNSSGNHVGINTVVAITGNGFIPNSIARVNGSDRVTVFIDYSHLLIKLNPKDTYNTNGIYINVFNGFPGGGYSNAEFFTVNNPAPVSNTNYTSNPSYTITKTTTTGENNTNNPNYNYSNSNQIENSANNTDDINNNRPNASDLAATAIFGSASFLPSGLIQWILFAIIILLIVIMVRNIFGAKKNYEEAPMKHA